MGPAYWVMAILGCGEGDVACQPAAVAEARYESFEACNAATAAAVMRHVDLAFPVVTAQCRRADADLAGQLMPRDIDLPGPDGDRVRPPVRRAEFQPPRKRGI